MRKPAHRYRRFADVFDQRVRANRAFVQRDGSLQRQREVFVGLLACRTTTRCRVAVTVQSLNDLHRATAHVADADADDQRFAQRLVRVQRAEVERVGDALAVEPVEAVGKRRTAEQIAARAVAHLKDVAAGAVAHAEARAVGGRIEQLHLERVVGQIEHGRTSAARQPSTANNPSTYSADTAQLRERDRRSRSAATS